MEKKPTTTKGKKTPNLEVLGKVPPHSKEVEEAVIGALMLGDEAIRDVVEMLKPENFYIQSHQKIYATILDLYQKNAPVNILSVCEDLSKKDELNEIGGRSFVAELTNKIDSTAHIEFNARIVLDKSMLRSLIEVAHEIQIQAFDENTELTELIEYSENEIFQISDGNIKKGAAPMAMILKESMLKIEENVARGGGFTGIPSGFTELDRITNGWQASDLIIVAARPAMGKTAFVLSLARNIAVISKKPVAFFSLEMSSVQLVTRLISSEAKVHSGALRSGNISHEQFLKIETSLGNLRNAEMFIDDTAGISLIELRAKCRRLMHEHKIGIIIIDYLQLMTTGGRSDNRQEEVAAISRALKGLAKELNVPVIALSQLSRAVESRGKNKRPMLSDLRESGSIEQDADIVMFIHREEYYGNFQDADGNSTIGIAEVIIAKHRNGETATVKLKFTPEYAMFSDLGYSGLPEPEPEFEYEVITTASKGSIKYNQELDPNVNFDNDNNYDLLSNINPDEGDIPF